MQDAFRSWLLFQWAKLLLFVGFRARAIEALRTVVQEDPHHVRAWTSLGFLHAEQGRLREATQAFDQALALRTDAPTLFNAGYVLQRAGRHEAAMGHFQRAIALDANLDRAWYGLGLSLAHEGRHEEAIPKFEEAARLQPFNPYAGYQLAAAWFKLGRQDKVQSEYVRVKGFDPKVAERIRLDFGAAPV